MNNPKATVEIKKLILDLMNLASKQYFSKWLTLVPVKLGQDQVPYANSCYKCVRFIGARSFTQSKDLLANVNSFLGFNFVEIIFIVISRFNSFTNPQLPIVVKNQPTVYFYI